jgi:hypothetical protein
MKPRKIKIEEAWMLEIRGWIIQSASLLVTSAALELYHRMQLSIIKANFDHSEPKIKLTVREIVLLHHLLSWSEEYSILGSPQFLELSQMVTEYKLTIKNKQEEFLKLSQ